MKKQAFINLVTDEFSKQYQADSEAVLLDVRTPSEFVLGHFAEAVNIDIKNEDFLSEIEELDKSKSYYVYCSLGIRSVNACRAMRTLGFGQLYNLKGGLKA